MPDRCRVKIAAVGRLQITRSGWEPSGPLRLRRIGPTQEAPLSYVVDFQDVSTVGVESSPVAEALAGLRANEARYFRNKYDHGFTVEPAGEASEVVDWVHG